MKINQEQFNLLRKLNNNPEASQRELATELEISLGKLNYVLNELKKKGLVKISNFKKNQNKSRYLYLLTPKGIAEKTQITLNFMKRKLQEYEELKTELENLDSEEIKNVDSSNNKKS
jgi:EPS-associated MarR family transcriptional regulator